MMKSYFFVCLLLLSSLESFSQVNLSAGLMAYYPFNGNANDASGNGNNPVFNNATLTTDRLGNANSAYSFNGTDNYIRIPNSVSLNSSNQISICAWVKVSGFYQGTCHGNNVVMKGSADYQAGNYKIRFDDSYFTNSQNCYIPGPDITHETFFGLNSVQSPASPFVQTNQWYSVVYTCDGVTAKIYVNCKLAGSGPANGLTFTNSDDLFLGTLNDPQYPYWFNGTMDEIRIYNRAINEDEIKAYSDCTTSSASCNNWLSTPARYSYVDIGKLNVTGNHITVEAVFNRTQSYVPGGGDGTEGDLVSKHDNPTDINYLLRPNEGSITTTNGFFTTSVVSTANLNQTYHVAMVYDGDTLKFFRDGCLISKVAASGDLFQNNWDTRIGYYQNQIWNTNFIGYINEVRIWNIARTQAQIQAYMNTSLPNPTTQVGLLAYYTFDNLSNKQGNPAWNGTLSGSASINQTNTNCNAIVNDCPVPPPVCNILITKNADTSVCAESPVSMFATGGTSFSWSPAAGLSNPNSANPVATPVATTKYYVTVSDVNGCSKLDSVMVNIKALPVIVKSKDTGICINTYVPLFASGGDSYLWSPSVGLSDPNSANPVATPLTSTKYFVTVTNTAGCSKKDSVNILVNSLPVISKSNDTSICLNSQTPLFATGGTSYRWQPSVSLNNPNSQNPVATPLSTTKYYVTVSNGGCTKKDSVTITVNSLPVIAKSNDTSVCFNSIVPLFASGGTSYSWQPSTGLDNSLIANPTAIAKANTTYYVAVKNVAGCVKMDSVKIQVNSLPVIVKSKDTSICLNDQVTLSASGGSSYVWSPSTGLSNPNVSKPIASPVATTKYYVTVTSAAGCSKNDSVNINVNNLPLISKSNDTTICKNTQAQLIVSGGINYAWSPAASLNNANVPNPIASPATNTTYNVAVTNSDGCTKIASVVVNIKPVPDITKSNDSLICSKASVNIYATGGTSYNWSPSVTLSNPFSATPVASPAVTTMYHVRITDAQSCAYYDSVKISVRPPAVFAVSANQQICEKMSQQLNASGGDSYTWTPASFLDNPNSNSPVASPGQTTTYYVTIKENTCNESATLATMVTVLPTPIVHAQKSNDITCTQPSTRLSALGANNYSWIPTTGLDNANIANPVASPQISTVYILTGKDQNGCEGKDSISVNVDYDKNTFYGVPNSFTPNNDGLNDCFGVVHWGQVSQLDFSVYNRLGQRVFHTNNPSVCWDGTFKGQPQEAGVFVYVIKAKNACGNIDRKGTVTLLR